MGLAHHQPQAGEAAFFERGHELAPEALALTVAHLELQQLPAAIRVHPHGDDHGSGADLQGLAQPAMEVGGIEVNVGVAGLLQGPVHEGLHLFVDVAHLGGQAAGSVTVAVAEPLLTALVALCADHGSDLELDQLLQTAPHQLGDQLSGGASVQ